jgi:hypothetical protein
MAVVGRAGIGLTAAGVALTAAVLSQGIPVLAGLFVALTVLILIGTFANRIRGLHHLPLVGAPKPSVEFELDGHPDLRVGLSPEGQRGSLLLIRIRIPKRAELASAWINVLFPRGIREERVDAYGDPRPGGTWLQPVKHRLGAHEWADRWVVQDVRLGGDLAHEFWFKLRFRQTGSYPVLLKLGDPVLYEETTACPTIEVESAIHPLTRRERLRHLVDEGERLSQRDPSRAAVVDWLFQVRQAVPEDLRDLFDSAPPQEGESLSELVHRRLRSLRDVLRAAA